MTQARYGGRGRVDGRGGRDGRGGAGRNGRGNGYSTKPKTIKTGLCKELDGHVFEYGGHGAADTMRTTMEKLHQYVGVKYGEDIANELKNRVTVVVTPPKYSLAIEARHVEYEALVRTKQSTLLAAMQAQLANLQPVAAIGAAAAAGGIPGQGDDVLLVIARLENDIADLEFESRQPVPHKLTSEEAALYYNDGKTYSMRVATLEKHRGQAFATIIGQCTQLLLDKMKQEKTWEVVSASYKPLELYKLIESVVLKQTEDQYPVAAVWEQYGQVYNAKQGSMTNTEWYERFNTKVEVAESVGCKFACDKTLDYCAELQYKMSYARLGPAEQAAVDILARDRFIAFGLLKTSSNSHDKIKSDLSDDYTKGSDNYPITPQQTLLLLDKYSKKPALMAQSEGTAFAQKGKKGDAKKKAGDDDPKKFEYDKDFYKERVCFRCGKKGHPKAACTVKLAAADEEKSAKSSSSKGSGSSSDIGKMLGAMNKSIKTFGKALSQVSEEYDNLGDDDSIGAQSHAQVGHIGLGGSREYAFASRSTSLRGHVLLDNQSSVHVFCDPELVNNIRKGERQLSLESNGGKLPISDIANFEGFEEAVWFSTEAMTNILSLAVVKREYEVSYDGDAFIIHRAKHGYPDMVFKPHESGLHVLDIDDSRSHASYAFVETVADNMSLFTKRQIASANQARDLQAGLGFPSIPDLKWIVQANMLKDSPVVTQDVDVALKIYGPSVALLKGKTVRRKAPVVIQDVIEVPTEIRQLHKRVTLAIDIFFVNGVPYFATLSLRICFLSVTHLSNRKIPTIFKALRAMHNYYLQRGFQIVFIKGDGEFKPLEVLIESELYGGPKMNLTSANEHVPEIERKIRVIKERVRAIVYSIPVNALPALLVVHAVLFATKALNLFPVKGGISGWSPKQIMTGEVVYYKYCCVPFGCYCQISKEGTPRNSMLARTQGAIALGPSGNTQGGHKFYTLDTGCVVVRRQWVRLPMTDAVIARINLLAVGQPSQPVFTDRKGRPIGDVAMEHFNYNEADDELPGVHLPGSDESAEIPGVGTIDQDPEMPDLLDDDVDVGIDFDSHEPQDPAELVQHDNDAPVPVMGESPGTEPGAPVGRTGVEPSAPAGVRRSTRERVQVKSYQPSMSGKKYAFAAMELVTTELGLSFFNDESYQHDAKVAYAFMQQLSLKSALKQWGTDTEDAGVKEVSQLHWRDTFVPRRYSELTVEQKKKVLESHMFVVKKRDGKTKARMVAGGNAQRDYLTKEESSSPTVSTEAVLLTSVVDAHEKRNVIVIDIPNAFIQTRVNDPKDRVIIRMRGVVVDWLVQAAPEVYGPFVTKDKKGDSVLLVECWNAIYGTMIAGLLYYRKFSDSLTEQGYVANAYDPCVWNKIIKGKQSTICFHVDDCKISHVSVKVNDDTIKWLRRDYESIFTDGSGEMKVARGKVHKYLGMKLDFTTAGVVIVTMIDYVDDVTKAWDEASAKLDDGFKLVAKRQRIATAAPDDLFKVNDDAMKLEKGKAKSFHSIVQMMLYVTKRARPDTALAVAFLTTRVREPDVDDWRKLDHLIYYLKCTRELPLVLGATTTGVLHWYVDASFATHQDMRGHTGGALTLGRGCPTVQSTKAKCNTRSSTISELVAVDEMLAQILWTRLFMKAQGIEVSDNILYQDNKSAILLEKNGRASSSKRTKHIEIRYYYVADRITKGDLTVVWCPTAKMIADFLTKPLQGRMFIQFRDVLMGAVPMWYDVD